MLAKRIAQTVIVCFAVLGLQLALARSVIAQAWVPEKGEGSVTFTYQKLDVRDHFDAAGSEEDRGRIHTHNIIMALAYGLTDKLAVDFDLAFVASQFEPSRFEARGRRPHGPDDDGFFHPKFQDTHIDLRYNVLKRSLVVTPFIGVTIPTHDYEVRGHTAVGRGFHELRFGANVGRQLNPIFPDGYVHLRYSYAILKRFAGFNLNHSNADWEIGWFANKLISFRLIGSWQKSHGGREFPAGGRLTPEEFEIHDRVAKANYTQVGGGATFSVNRSFDIHAAYATTLSAQNTHGDAGIILGFSWRFSRGSSNRIASNAAPGKLPTIGQGMF
ncbi:MAG: hypothetical protein ABI596_08230 [Pyrinomonadaceae bacterium]